MRGNSSAVLFATVVGALLCVPSVFAAAPPNDDFAAAQVIQGEAGTANGSNVDATEQAGENDHAGDAGGASVWYSWSAPRSGVLLMDTCDSGFDTLLAVYTGTQVDSLTVVGSDDDGCAPQSALELEVVQGTQYRIAVDGSAGATGAVELWWAMTPPNDDRAGAQVITGEGGSVDGTNSYAGHEAGEPFHAGAPGGGSVWYRWTAPRNLTMELRVCESDFDTVIAVYDAGTEVASDDDACAPGSSVDFDARAGFTYEIAVDGFAPGDQGAFTLRWQISRPPIATTPPSITGTPLDGETLTGQLGEWTGAQPITYQHWWEWCGSDSNCYRAYEITGATYQAAPGRRLRFAVQATNRRGATTAYSPIVTVAYRPIVNLAPPVISPGRARVGVELTLETMGEWGGSQPMNLVIQWMRCGTGGSSCTHVAGGPADETYYAYTPVAADVGYVLRVVVGATNGVSVGSAWSAPSGVVQAAARNPRRLVCAVPRVVGKTAAQARKALQRSRCKFRLVVAGRAWSARAEGRVISQTPRPGFRLVPNGRVRVILSRGRRR